MLRLNAQATTKPLFSIQKFLTPSKEKTNNNNNNNNKKTLALLKQKKYIPLKGSNFQKLPAEKISSISYGSQPRPQGLLLVQNGCRRNPWPRLPKWFQKFVRISTRKHDEMSSFCSNNGFRLQKTNKAARRWKRTPKKPFHQVSRDKILHDSWSSSAAAWPGVSPTAILNEKKALGTRLDGSRK